MTPFRVRDGRQRLWIARDEIERRMEGELRAAGLYPRDEAPAVDLEGFVENHLKVRVDGYAPLPSEVLGLTRFYTTGKPQILINRDLTEEAMDKHDSPTWLKGRWRATMAHEASHVVFHQRLFAPDPTQAQLLEVAKAESPQGDQRCLKRDVQFAGRNSDWREIQANMGMAALLMPRALFCALCASELGIAAFDVGVCTGTAEAGALAERMALRFQVSRQAATIRLETLGIVRPAGQRSLA